MTLRELREKRNKLIKDARTINDLAAKENRDLSDDEDTQFTAMMKEADELRIKIQRDERLQEAERELAESQALEAEASQRDRHDAGEGRGNEREAEQRGQLVLKQYRNYLLNGGALLDTDEMKELRNLSSGLDVEGGFVITPEQVVQTLIKALDDEVFIRRLGTTFPVAAARSLGAASLDSDPDDGEWTTELSTGSDDTGMKFGRRQLTPHLLVKRIKVSMQLLRNAAIPVENLVRDRLLYKLSLTQEKGFLTGNGALQPLGIFTASNDGIPTSQDVSTDNTATEVTMDGLKSAKYFLKGQYQGRAEWLFHRDAVLQISKLKDTTDQYLWQPSNQAGQPDRLLSRPVNMSENVPNTFTTGLYVGMFADFSHYWIADSMELQIQRLMELYAESNQIGFITRSHTDGMPVLAEAFARITLA